MNNSTAREIAEKIFLFYMNSNNPLVPAIEEALKSYGNQKLEEVGCELTKEAIFQAEQFSTKEAVILRVMSDRIRALKEN